MVSKYGFKRMLDIEEVNQKVYTNDSNEIDKLIVIIVIKNHKNCYNILSIVMGSADSIAELKKICLL